MSQGTTGLLLVLTYRVECRCWNSRGQIWMINRNSVNWPCGLHASYTDMSSCLDPWFAAQPKENRTRTYNMPRGWESNPRPPDHKSDALTTKPRCSAAMNGNYEVYISSEVSIFTIHEQNRLRHNKTLARGRLSSANGCPTAVIPATPDTLKVRPHWYRYMTILRDPITRFFSEWMNVRSGRTWMESRLHCGGRDATIEEVPWCFEGSRWVEPTIDEYLACPGNMGINRMTRMLADLNLSDCYRLDSNKTKTERDEIMLASAKSNLAQFTAFGLTEYPEQTQALLEKSVTGMKFKSPLARDPDINYGTSYVILSDDVWNKMVDVNHLDVRLYQYAKDLFFQRLESVGVPVPAGQFEAVRVSENFIYKIVHVV
ncbi:heparan-sulfate 6-O-sulfotransferase 3 [Elysia marginata]|uniref:Heparan-sulfate 6-O-sulfotransferase n=1 Tax=Elysia marginata TaxID=1093978 RepID=A0AAV4FFC2_9GAST|nr:heparan-sulfate 6-O-sulfotransferase 3 [Elysia marginata]